MRSGAGEVKFRKRPLLNISIEDAAFDSPMEPAGSGALHQLMWTFLDMKICGDKCTPVTRTRQNEPQITPILFT